MIDLSCCYTLFKLVAGAPGAGVNLNNLGEPYRTGALAVLNANGKGRATAFNEWLSTLEDNLAGEIRHAMRTWQVNGQPDQPIPANEVVDEPEPSQAPALPQAACLTPQQERAAQSCGEWLNEYIRFASQAAPMTPAEFHEALGLVIVATAIARRLALAVSTTRIFPNLYVLLVARSTLWHKTTGFELARKVMDCAGMACLQIGPRQTPESLMLELSTRRPQSFGDWDKASQEQWRQERVFSAQRAWLMEEASSLFDSFNRDYNAGLLPMLLDLHDCPGERQINTIGRGRQTIRRVYLTIAGPTTPAALAPHMANRAHWENGLWARFALVTPTGMPQWKFWPEPMDIPSALTDPIKRLAFERLAVPVIEEDEGGANENPAEPLAVSLGQGVWDAWERYSKAVAFDLLMGNEVDGQLFANYGRLGTTAIKIAMLLATLDWIDTRTVKTPTVKMAHWARAQQIAEAWRASLHRMIDAPVTESTRALLERRIIHRLKENGAEMTARELNRYLRVERDELDMTLMRLVADGLLVQVSRKGQRGPGAVAYRLG